MRYIILLVMIVCLPWHAQSQKAEQHFDNAFKKHEAGDYNGAIEEYTNAIAKDRAYTKAYFNRGLCKFQLEKYPEAEIDFTEVIKQQPSNANAYYSKAMSEYLQYKIAEARADVEKTISLDSTIAEAYSLRGSLWSLIGNEVEACRNFYKARKLGDYSQGLSALMDRYCGGAFPGFEYMILPWEEKKDWVMLTQTGDVTSNIKLFKPISEAKEESNLSNITLKTEMALMVRFISDQSAGDFLKENYADILKESPGAVMKTIDKNLNTAFPWVLCRIDNVVSVEDGINICQLWHVVQGKNTLYVNSVKMKTQDVTDERIKQWTSFLKKGKVVPF